MDIDLDALLAKAVMQVDEVPEELVPRREPVSAGLTYEDLMSLLRRLEDEPFGWEQPVHPHVRDIYLERAGSALDVFERERREGETRARAKTRIMLEAYSLDGRQIRDADLWRLRAQYVWIRQYVQGMGDGLPYNTHNWVHFYSRYGSGGAREVSLMIGLRHDTVAECARLCAAESAARVALRLLSAE